MYPPVDTAFFQPPADATARAASVLIVSALVPYKRLDVAIAAASLAKVPLRVVGQGPEEGRLRRLSEGKDVEFLGWRSDEEIRALYQSSAAVLMPGVEDFGIVPVEAQACGTPVIALAAGGALETIVDGETGMLVDQPTADAFASAISRAVEHPVDRIAIRRNAERFSKGAFSRAFAAAVADAIAEGAQP